MTKTIEGKRGGTLTPWQPGQSGNPNGLPKGYKMLTTRLKEVCNTGIKYKDINRKDKRMKVGDAIMTALVAKAIYGGDLDAIECILKHVDKDLEAATPLLVQNNFTQQGTTTNNVLGLSDKQVLEIAAIFEAD